MAVGAAVGIAGVAEEADEVVNVEASDTVLEAAQVVVANATTLATTLARQSSAPASTVALGAQSACPLR